MTRRSLLAVGAPSIAALLLASCAGGPLPPAWQTGAHASLEAFTAAYLNGKRRVADAEFSRARAELARTGRFDLVARAELVRCAVRVASVEFDGCPGYAALAQDAGPAEDAYAAFLANRPTDPALLPPQYRSLRGGDALSTIEEPLPRLIAAGVRLERGQLNAADIQTAVDTASAQGWRRPLLAWLGVQEKRAASASQDELAASLRRRIELVGGER
ncbi:hypothetical protein [Candidatus Accumulibacter sp. ACC003]|uniref:hypothetical protein n=1 Tax=Candidatus Accumulibacter sp. ACC003 TaxID=2823334 RepID=UPI0025BFE271|nr:hypothetical protein [Candidatus Accumulibacter sp. ACC003]